MPKCINLRTERGGPAVVYIGRKRGSRMHYGNPFMIGRDGNRDQVCNKHIMWLEGTAYQGLEPERREWILEHIPDLWGKDLTCFCAPLR